MFVCREQRLNPKCKFVIHGSTSTRILDHLTHLRTTAVYQSLTTKAGIGKNMPGICGTGNPQVQMSRTHDLNRDDDYDMKSYSFQYKFVFLEDAQLQTLVGQLRERGIDPEGSLTKLGLPEAIRIDILNSQVLHSEQITFQKSPTDKNENERFCAILSPQSNKIITDFAHAIVRFTEVLRDAANGVPVQTNDVEKALTSQTPNS